MTHALLSYSYWIVPFFITLVILHIGLGEYNKHQRKQEDGKEVKIPFRFQFWAFLLISLGWGFSHWSAYGYKHNPVNKPNTQEKERIEEIMSAPPPPPQEKRLTMQEKWELKQKEAEEKRNKSKENFDSLPDAE